MRIAAYTCAKNESAFAARWAASAAEGDAMLWFVNNDNTNTAEAAKDAGITTVEGTLKPFRFDTARNIAMALVPSDIDVVIQLDADETLSEGWADHFKANPNHERWSYTLVSGGTAQWDKVVRSNANVRAGYTWKHPIHEVLHGPAATCHLPAVTVTHQPDKHKSRSLYLPLLQQAAQDEPNNLRMQFYLGREHYYAGDWAKARQVLYSFAQNSSAWSAEACEAFRIIAKISDDTERWLYRAVAICPQRREPWVDLAVMYLNNDQPGAAQAMIQQATKRTDTTIYTTDIAAWGEQFDKLIEKVKQ